MPEFLEICEQAARKGGAELLKWAGRFSVKEKGPKDLVTEADLASDAAIRQTVRGAFPDHAFLSEEHPHESGSGAEFRWILDPLDGTTNYVHAVPDYAVSLALEHAGQIVAGVVFNPVTGECFSAAKGHGAYLNGQPLHVSAVTNLDRALVSASFKPRINRHDPEVRQFVRALEACQSVRRMGSAALNLCFVAAGRFDAYWSASTHIWDVAAGVLMVREAGGLVGGIDDAPLDLNNPRLIAASTTTLYGQLRELFHSPD